MEKQIQKMARLLYEACIDHTIHGKVIAIDTLEKTYAECTQDGWRLYGSGFGGHFCYSEEYVVRVLDKIFRGEKESEEE